jgi:hypothetical protein
MSKIIERGILAAAAGAAVVSGTYIAVHHPASAPVRSLSCRDVTPGIRANLADLRAYDAQAHAHPDTFIQQEPWTNDSQEANLKALITITGRAHGTDYLNADSATFHSDATSYIQNYGYIRQADRSSYFQIRGDINSMAFDCGIHGVSPLGPGQ